MMRPFIYGNLTVGKREHHSVRRLGASNTDECFGETNKYLEARLPQIFSGGFTCGEV